MTEKRRKKPTFARQNAHRKVRVSSSWRRPRGMYSKQALGKKSHGAHPNAGYRQPKSIRGLHPCGLQEVLVRTMSELENVDPKTHCVRIGRTVGARKKKEIVDAATQKNIKILN